jgi:hypothetical protein
MNFEKLSRIMENNGNPGGSQIAPTPNTNPTLNPAIDRSKTDTNQIIRKLTTKLGEDPVVYKPLINYLARNSEALMLFNALLDKVGTMSASKAATVLQAR